VHFLPQNACTGKKCLAAWLCPHPLVKLTTLPHPPPIEFKGKGNGKAEKEGENESGREG